MIASNLEFNTQFGVTPFLRALMMIWESPSIISFLMLSLIHRLIYSSTASFLVILFDAISKDLDLLTIHSPY